MDNLNYWPYTDIHELNLDWILEKVKALDAKLNDDIDTYVQEYIDEHFEDWTVNANYDPDTQTIVYTNGTGAQQTLGDVIRFAIDNVFVNIKDATARTAAATAQNTANNATSAAGTAQSTANNNTGSITTINNKIGTATLATDAQTLTGAINEVEDEVISSVGKKTLGDDDWEEFRNKLVYVNGIGGKINSQNTLEKLLAAGSVNSSVNTQNKEEQRGNDSYNDFKKSIKNSLNTKFKDLSRDEIREIFLDIFDELGVAR